MEKVAWIFNGDFEQRLFGNLSNSYQSSKMTQEFEYFISLIDPDKLIYTSKNYADEYIDHIEKFKGTKFLITAKAKEVLPWCADYVNIELLRKLQSKENTLKFLQQEKLIDEEIEYITSSSKLEEGFLYKYSKSLSGGGHCHFPRDEKKILKLLKNGETLIKEKIHQRLMDFSTLVEDGKVLAIYENFIDEYYQYKGTCISHDFSLSEKINNEYQNSLDKILEYTKDYRGIMSIDSYLYKEGKDIRLFPACEINVRKTMGYVALRLKELYFPQSRHLKLLLKKNNGELKNYNQVSALDKNIKMISPLDNRFYVFLLVNDSFDELMNLEERLLTTFF